MKLRSVYSFFKWELTKLARQGQEKLDDLLWKPHKSIQLSYYLSLHGNTESFFFIQIGANDGVTGDKLNSYIEKYQWHGILIEPVPYIFERLKKNYQLNTNLLFENSAIGKSNGFLPFYSISEYNYKGIKHSEIFNGFGLDQLGSFNKKTILKHASMTPDFESYIKEIEVPTITLETLFLKYEVGKVDLLQIDTEGYDFEILNNVDFKNIKPKILVFEHQHISRIEYKILIKKLKGNGYNFFINGWDTVCLLKTFKIK